MVIQPKSKVGFNPKMYKSLESVQKVNSMQPVLSMNDKAQKKIEPEDDNDSEDEWMNQDFFESSVFWQHEQQMRKGTLNIKDAKEIKDKRKMMMAVNS